MKYLLLILVTLQVSYAQNLKRSKWDMVLKLINEEEHTINMVKRKSSSLKYRLLELKAERIKIWQQKENDVFMGKSTRGIKISRAKAFIKTRALYKEAMNFGLELIRKHPRSKYVPSIYYTLALNSRDYAQDGKEYRFLQKAINLSASSSDINYYARTSLAEYYYNQKKYKKAVKLYKGIISNKTDQWYTKNLYNYGWCLLKTHKFNKAIDTLENAYKLSGNGHYINFRDQIVVGLTSFYVVGKQIKRGKSFILDQAEDKYEALFKFTKKVAAKGYYEESIDLIRLLPDYFDSKKKVTQLADVTLYEYDFYKQFNQKDKMYAMARKLNQITLNQEQKDEAVQKMATEVGEQQQILKKSFDKHGQSYEVALLKEVMEYFDILAKIDSKNKAKYLFYQAESNYSVHEFKKALPLYKASLETYLANKADLDVSKNSMDGIFSSIEFGKYDKKEELGHLEYAYQKHIEVWPKSKKSQTIFPKLFSLYLAKKDLYRTQETLDRYAKAFPKDLKKQQELFKVQLDLIIKNKDSNLLADKINLLNKKYLAFDTKMVKKTEKILATMLFNEYQNLNKAGKKEEALTGYKSIFYTSKYPQAIKADAAFNMGIIYVDLLQTKDAIKWFEKGLPLFERKEMDKRRAYLDKVALRASLLQDLLNAAQLKKLVLKEFCTKTPKKNYQTFNQAIQFDLANNYVVKALHTYKTYKKCTKQSLISIQETIMDHLYLNDHQTDFLSFIDEEKLKNKFTTKIGAYYEKLYWRYHQKNQGQESLYYYRIKKLNCESCKLLVSSNRKYIKLVDRVVKFKRNYMRLKTPFSPENFNLQLNQRISSIKPILHQAEDILKGGHPEYSILIFEQMVELIEYSSSEIRELNPEIKDPTFVKQFKAQMKMVANNIYGQKISIQQRVDKLIQQNQLFTNKQNKTHYAYEVLQISDIRNPASKMVSTMDLKD